MITALSVKTAMYPFPQQIKQRDYEILLLEKQVQFLHTYLFIVLLNFLTMQSTPDF